MKITITRVASRKGHTHRSSVGTLTRGKLAAGTHSLGFSGRLGRRALQPGRYHATIVATDAAGNASKPHTISFTIVG